PAASASITCTATAHGPGTFRLYLSTGNRAASQLPHGKLHDTEQSPTSGCVIVGVAPDSTTPWMATRDPPTSPSAPLPSRFSPPLVFVWKPTYIAFPAEAVCTRSMATISPSGSITHSRCA